MKHFILIVCSLLLCFSATASSEDGKIRIRSFSQFADLPHSDVNDIVQDSMGYMWFATYGGLCRWDGYRLEIYNAENSPLNRERVLKLCATADSLLYVGVESGGLNAIDLRTMTFLEVEYDYKFSEDEPFSFCVGIDGFCYYTHSNRLSRLEYENGKVNVKTELFLNNVIESSLPSDDGIYLGTSKGLVLYSRGRIVDTVPSLCWIKDMAFSDDGNIIAATPDGLFLIDRELRSSQKVTDVPCHTVMSEKGEAIWLGTNNDGLIKFDNKDLSVNRVFEFTPFMQDQLTSAEISSLYKDRTGVLWIGTIGGGLNILNLDDSEIRCYTSEEGLCMDRVMAFNELGECLMVSTRGGGLDLMTPSGQFNHLKINGRDSKAFPIVSSFCRMEDGTILLGTWEHGVWEATTSGENSISAVKCGVPELSNLSINDLVLDPAGRLWFCTADGLYRQDRRTGEILSLKGRLSSDFITSACFQTEGDDIAVWVATRQGLDRISEMPDGSPSISNILPGYFVSDLLVDRAGRLWITTLGEGVWRMENGKMIRFQPEYGRFISNEIESVREDNDGVLWFGGYGITSYNSDSGVLTNFTQKDGLQSNSFKIGASLLRRNGELVFGGTQGFNIMNPKDVKISRHESSPAITAVWCGEKRLAPEDCYSLVYDQNSLRFEFSSMVYNDIATDRFRYKLEGYEDDWNESDWHSPEATYLHLPAGRYKFIVHSSDYAGDWNPNPASIEICIKPHPLVSPLAILTYCILLIAGLLASLKFAFNRQKERNRRKAEEEKFRLFTDMAHEIKTPLSLIVAPVDELLENRTIGDSTRRKLQTVHRNVESLRTIVEQLLDLRKYEDKLLKISVAEVDVCRILKETATLFTSYAYSKGILLKTELGTGPQMLFLDKSKIERVIVNLISNAIKFTPAGGCVIIKCTSDAKTVTFSVEDNGAGIRKQDQSRIFDRFYQSDNQTQSSAGGTGIGLALSKSIIDMHGGQISVESELGFGSKFYVRLLKGRDHFSDDQIDSDYASSDSLSNYDPIDHSSSVTLSTNEAVVLVADDNEGIREYIAEALSDRYEVITAKDGKEAWDNVLSCTPDLVLSDVVMPEMNGIELCGRIKQNPETMHIPVILLTARDLSATELESLKVGADAFMTKPFRINVLYSRIRNLIDSRDRIRRIYGKTIDVAPSEITVEAADEKFVRRCTEIVEKHIDESDFGVEQLCREACISSAQLYRKLKSTTGLQPLHFIREIRLKRAAQLLSKDNTSVSDVMYKVGFNNQSYFTKLFKERFGCLPRDFTSDDFAKI